MSIRPPGPTGALADMLEQDGVLDDLVSGRGLVFQRDPPPPPAPPPEFIIEPYDGSSFVEPVREPDPPPREETESAPAKPTPNLNKARQWRAQMMRPAS